MNKVVVLAVCALFGASLALPALAEDGVAIETAVEPTGVTEDQVVAQPIIAVEAVQAEPTAVTTTEETKVEETQKVPSNWGLWWRNVKEKIVLATTVNAVKNAEKRLQFAGERMNLAKVIAEKATDPKVQAKAEQMMEKAQVMMNNVLEKKDKWMNSKEKERVQKLIGNIVKHQENKEAITDRLEEKLPEAEVERIREKRQESLEKDERLLNAINNENVPAEIKAKLQEVQSKIEEHQVEVKKYNEEKKELLTKMQEAQDKEAKEAVKTELKELRQERNEAIKENKEEKIELKRNKKLETGPFESLRVTQ